MCFNYLLWYFMYMLRWHEITSCFSFSTFHTWTNNETNLRENLTLANYQLIPLHKDDLTKLMMSQWFIQPKAKSSTLEYNVNSTIFTRSQLIYKLTKMVECFFNKFIVYQMCFRMQRILDCIGDAQAPNNGFFFKGFFFQFCSQPRYQATPNSMIWGKTKEDMGNDVVGCFKHLELWKISISLGGKFAKFWDSNNNFQNSNSNFQSQITTFKTQTTIFRFK